MSTVRNPFKRRITAGIGIAALATAALFGSMLPASAADSGNINPDAAKSLTIHKFAQPAEEGTAPDGTKLPDSATSGLDKLSGVTFKVEEVTNIDLSNNAGWLALDGLTPATVDTTKLELVDEKATVDGVVTFVIRKQAVYLVTETGPGANNIAFAAQPFLVTLPLPNNTDNTWIYDVHVYPKNSLASITKTVDDEAATGLGDKVTWNIAAKVPNASEGNKLESFVIEDKLDSRLAYDNSNSTLTLASGDTVTSPEDYTVDPSVANTVTYTFTDTGLTKLKAGDKVNIALVTTVVSLGEASGIIENKATVFINDSETTSLKAETHWGDVTIHKVSANETGKSLQGAEFKVYTDMDDAKNGVNEVSVTSAGVTKNVFTSGDDGIVNIAGLRATVNGTGTKIDYYLVETKAPAGYNINPKFSKAEPHKFNVDSDLTTDIAITVKNAQTPPFTLPLTGGSGTAMFMTVGLGLLAVAGGVAIRKRSTRRAVQA